MPFPQRCVLLILFLVSLSPFAHAGIVGDALFSFPAQTEYLEYDNLVALRKLPNYNTLRKEFSGKPLEEARIVLASSAFQRTRYKKLSAGRVPLRFMDSWPEHSAATR